MKYTFLPCQRLDNVWWNHVKPRSLPSKHPKDVNFDKFDTSCKEKGLVFVAFFRPDTRVTRASVPSHYKLPNGLKWDIVG